MFCAAAAYSSDLTCPHRNSQEKIHVHLTTGACPGFLKGGGPISLGSLKKGHQILKGGGSNGLKGGSSTFVSL